MKLRCPNCSPTSRRPARLPGIFHGPIQSPASCSRRGNEADGNFAQSIPPPHVGGYKARGWRPRGGGDRGFAVLVIFVLLTIMVVFVTSNALVLRHLHQEIKLVEKRQVKKYEAAPANSPVRTNAPSAGLEKRLE
jgi:hypothetical protein